MYLVLSFACLVAGDVGVRRNVSRPANHLVAGLVVCRCSLGGCTCCDVVVVGRGSLCARVCVLVLLLLVAFLVASRQVLPLRQPRSPALLIRLVVLVL